MNNPSWTNSKTGYSPVRSDDVAFPVIEDAVAVPVADRVEVTAPESLPAGYELHCEFRGRVTIVRVPPGGVVKGQKFVADVISQLPDSTEVSRGGHRIPHGHFRDGICDCFKHGCCHPMLCLACWFPPLALGQVMTRVHLNARGSYVDEGRRNLYFSAFKVLAVVFALYIGIDQVMSTLLTPYDKMLSPQFNSDTGEFIEPDYSLVPTWVWSVIAVRHVLQIGFGLYMLVLLIRTRSFIRRRYDIPEQCCQGCEDCCCAVWLPCCTTLQLARHTADYDTYGAACCTETGLPMNAPVVEII